MKQWREKKNSIQQRHILFNFLHSLFKWNIYSDGGSLVGKRWTLWNSIFAVSRSTHFGVDIYLYVYKTDCVPNAMEGWAPVAPIGKHTWWTVSIWTCDDDPLMDKMCWPATATDWMYSRAPTFMCLCFCWYDDCLTLLLSSHHGRGHIPLGIAVSEYSGTMSDAWCRLSLSIYGIFRATLSVPPVILTTNMLVARPSSQFTHSLPKKINVRLRQRVTSRVDNWSHLGWWLVAVVMVLSVWSDIHFHNFVLSNFPSVGSWFICRRTNHCHLSLTVTMCTSALRVDANTILR